MRPPAGSRDSVPVGVQGAKPPKANAFLNIDGAKMMPENAKVSETDLTLPF